MRYIGIAPIEEGDTPILNEDIPIVEIPMIERFRNAESSQFSTNFFGGGRKVSGDKIVI